MEEPMRVLMTTSEWPRYSWGGTSVFIVRQVEFLRRAGVDVDVFAFRGARRLGNYAAAWRDVRSKLRAGAYDLMHAQFGQSGLLAFPKQLPLVVTFRGDDLEGIIGEHGRYIPAGQLLRTLSRFVARQADAVVVVSEHMKRHLPPDVTAHVIPSGIDFSQFRPIPQDEARFRLGLARDIRLVLFVGDPGLARKRFPLAREAVGLVNRSMPARVVVGWELPHPAMPLYMSACDALICTSMQEGSPNVVKEALACDLPVVSVPVGDVPLRLGEIEGCELCADDRAETIAGALERVLRRGHRINGRDAVRHLDEELLTQQLIGIYRSALAGTRYRRPAWVAPAMSR
jgi:teichuronic acid biosynthesis glycosyltransferase TuaC